VQRPRAVVPGPDGDAEVVEHLPDVVRVHLGHLERHGAAAVLCRVGTQDPHPGDLAKRGQRVRGQGFLVRRDVVHAERGQVVDRG